MLTSTDTLFKFFRLLSPWIVSILAGIIIAVRLSLHLNLDKSIAFQSLPKVMSLIEVHLKKTPSPNLISLPGNMIFESDVQPSKANPPIDFIVDGIITPSSLPAPLKDFAPIDTTEYTTLLCFTFAGISTTPLTSEFFLSLILPLYVTSTVLLVLLFILKNNFWPSTVAEKTCSVHIDKCIILF